MFLEGFIILLDENGKAKNCGYLTVRIIVTENGSEDVTKKRNGIAVVLIDVIRKNSGKDIPY